MESGVAFLRHDGGNCIKFTYFFCIFLFSLLGCVQRYTRNNVKNRRKRSEYKKCWEFFHYIYFKLCMHKRYKVIIFEQTLFNAPSPDPNTFALKSTNICCYCLLMQTAILTLLVLLVLLLAIILFFWIFIYLCLSTLLITIVNK